MPSKKKKYNARFPPARIKKIMQTDEEVGKVAAAVPVIISRALELFIDSLITKSSETTLSKNAKTLTTSHIKQTIHAEKKFDFLRDLVAAIPDHQAEEDVAAGDGALSVDTKAVRRPRVPRPRKPKDGTVQKRRRKKKDESESSEEEESEEESEEEEEEAEGNGESAAALAGPSTSQQPSPFLPPLPPQASLGAPSQPPSIFFPRPALPNSSGVATATLPASAVGKQALAEDDDYDV